MKKLTIILLISFLFILRTANETIPRNSEFTQVKKQYSEYLRFKNALAKCESGNNYRAVNHNSKAIGRFQFTHVALKQINQDITYSQFISDANSWPLIAQDNAFDTWVNYICKNLREVIKMSEGWFICDGVIITKSGLIAAAHLGGCNGVKRFLKSRGKYNPGDHKYFDNGNGHTIKDYMIKFANYKF